jgi:hypothetical protein
MIAMTASYCQHLDTQSFAVTLIPKKTNKSTRSQRFTTKIPARTNGVKFTTEFLSCITVAQEHPTQELVCTCFQKF